MINNYRLMVLNFVTKYQCFWATTVYIKHKYFLSSVSFKSLDIFMLYWILALKSLTSNIETTRLVKKRIGYLKESQTYIV